MEEFISSQVNGLAILIFVGIFSLLVMGFGILSEIREIKKILKDFIKKKEEEKK